ncbi:MAG: DUF1638 domain-containing protein, partial [Moorella sp. (in: Bacteria)]|nr:DUF1638 domain-containing protein [Moorella sp. (in: firmicutes)]
CKVMEEELQALATTGYELHFLDQGLHRSPERLRQALQEAIDSTWDSELVLLGYGLCGGALEGLRAGPAPLIIPKVDDCIPLLLGSPEARQQWGPDTYFLSAGWLAGGENLVSEYARCLSRYGEERGDRLMRQLFRHYRRVVYIKTGRRGEEATGQTARATAEKLGLNFENTGGNKDYLRQLLRGPWDHLFLQVPPGTTFTATGWRPNTL